MKDDYRMVEIAVLRSYPRVETFDGKIIDISHSDPLHGGVTD